MSKKEEQLNQLLKEYDVDVSLDDDQRDVVLSDSDKKHCLVIAGAGAGKTTTVAAKVLYLIRCKGVDPTHILVLSYSRKAAAELKERIQVQYGQSKCAVSTFHSLGYRMLRDCPDEDIPEVLSPEEKDDWITDIFRKLVLNDKDMIEKILLLFSYYFDAESDKEFFLQAAEENRDPMLGRVLPYKGKALSEKSHKTIQGEWVRSYEEQQIANFLFLNGIPYEYEPKYPHGSPGYSKKIYTPDFLLKLGEKDVYLEHFGVSENGINKRYSPEENERYRKHMQDKRELHQQWDTVLLETYSNYKDGKSLLEHLESLLTSDYIREEYHFEICKKTDKELVDFYVNWLEDRYAKKMILLINRYITRFKTLRSDWGKVREYYQDYELNERSKLFLEICHACYTEYEARLKAKNRIDFEDMINKSIDILQDIKGGNTKSDLGYDYKNLDYDYIFVDEFQDISRQRFDFVKALSEVTHAKITAVGDDWQSIYGFSGSAIELFTKFKEKMGLTDDSAEYKKLEYTYRNSQQLIDVAGNFVQKNTAQIRKSLKSAKSLDSPVVIYTYNWECEPGDNWKKQREKENTAFAEAVNAALEDLVRGKEREGKEPGGILLLGRYHFDIQGLLDSGSFVRSNGKIKSREYPDLDLDFMTVHSSKGLGYDDVIVLNGKDEIYGFPSQVVEDPVLNLIPSGEDSTESEEVVDDAEERRLFYVALTRTKNRVFFVAPEKNPSKFLREIREDAIKQHTEPEKVVLHGKWSSKSREDNRDLCPLCGFPLVYKPRNRNYYGVDIYACTNEPELCDFITNDPGGKKLSITKCPDCDNGFLLVRHKEQELPGHTYVSYFLGCSNYKSGCTKKIDQISFYIDHGYDVDEI